MACVLVLDTSRRPRLKNTTASAAARIENWGGAGSSPGIKVVGVLFGATRGLPIDGAQVGVADSGVGDLLSRARVLSARSHAVTLVAEDRAPFQKDETREEGFLDLAGD